VTALHALLAGIVDYAGLFPPTAVDMPTAVGNYARYRASDEAWMLGRFVLPTSRLAAEFSAALDAAGDVVGAPWQLAALLGDDASRDLETIRAFNAAQRGRATVDVIEARLGTADAIAAVAAGVRGDFTLYVEVPLAPDPAPLVDAIHAAGAHAKVRMGGVTPDAFPGAEDVVRFMRRCVDARVMFKATAGLHHPFRGEQRLTYADDSPRGVMFGFVNLFAAAAFLEFGMSDDDARRLLEERDRRAFAISDAAIAWRGHTLSAQQVRLARAVVASSFGSCSFREPVDDLRTLSVLD